MMKNLLFISLLFIIVGCGAFDKKDLNDEKLLLDDEYVDFNDTNGTYDLVDYMFPNKSQNNIYVVETKNSDINGLLLNENNTSVMDEFILVDDNYITLGDKISYFIDKNTIIKEEFINNSYDIRKYKRFIDKGEVYFSYDEVNIQDTYIQVGKLVCRLQDHSNTMEILGYTYEDVVHLNCIGDFGEGANEGFNEETSFTIDGYYAKNIGLIGFLSYRCENKEYGNSGYTFCTDSKKSIQNILE
jgi:hypothetical protein